MKTISPPISPLEEAREKIRDLLSVMIELIQRLPQEEAELLRSDLVIAAEQSDEGRSGEELRRSLFQAFTSMSVRLLFLSSLSDIGKRFCLWLSRAVRHLNERKTAPEVDWIAFVQKWPRFWKAQILSMIALVDMAVSVGDSLEKEVSQTHQKEKKKFFLRCWKLVERGMRADTFQKLIVVLQKIREERKEANLDPRVVERSIGLEEFILKVMVEMAAKRIQEGGRLDVEIRECEYLQDAIQEHIALIGTEAAESSAITLVKESLEAELKYLFLCKRWGAVPQKPLSDPLERVERFRKFHETHCEVIDAYMELSDSKSLRGVMLCYEAPIFTQLLYDQRKRLDRQMQAVDQNP